MNQLKVLLIGALVFGFMQWTLSTCFISQDRALSIIQTFP
jgi:hypothetical protein